MWFSWVKIIDGAINDYISSSGELYAGKEKGREEGRNTAGYGDHVTTF